MAKKMKYRLLSLAMAVVMAFTLLPAAALAEEVQPEEEPAVCRELEGCTESAHAEGCPLYTKPETIPEPDEPAVLLEEEKAVYVSKRVDDESGNGSKDSPYASLAKAAEVINADEGRDYIIYVMSNLTMNECARFYNKNLTITSGDGGPYTVTRGDDFETQSDTARSWYNPAMIEVQGNQDGAECGLTLTNIILDDAGKHEGTVFAQASSGKSEGDESNKIYVQDAMIASNATVPCTITLGEGAVLRNFGGMSAVRVTDQAQLVMAAGSIIEDTTVTDRTKGKAQGEVGPAGAVWIQGSSFTMNAETVIQNIIGRAVYVDGGEATIGGKISNITGNANMWQGINGMAIHLRNSATGTLTATGLIENVSGIANGIIVYLNSSDFTMDNGSIINNHAENSADPKTHGIYSVDSKADQRNEVRINGEICGINGNPLQIANTNVNIGETGNLHNNFVNYGALYLQKNATADIYGKINNNNTATGRGGGIGTAGHGFVEINLYSGSEIKNNNSGNTGGGMSLKNCRLTMFGGEISNNNSKALGGGIYLYENASAILREGLLCNNIDNRGSNDLSITKKNNGNATNHLYISDKCSIENPAVYMESGNITVEATTGSRNLKLHNASKDSITSLTAEAQAKGWGTPIATFWTQRDGAANLTVGGLTTLNSSLPVYVLTQKTGADGKPASDAPIGIYAATVDADGSVNCTLPGGDVNGNGCAVAIVQPTVDYGSVVITGPNKITKNKTATTYEIPYALTYTMSQNLASVIEQGTDDATPAFTFVIELDSRLEAKEDCTLTSPIFDVVGTVTAVGNTLTVNCTLKTDWKDHIGEPTTLSGKGILNAGVFAAGDTLATTGNIQVTIPGRNIFIPANTCLTEMAALVEHTIIASADNNGSINPSGKVSVPEGYSQTFTITPDSGYKVSDVEVDGKSVGAVTSYKFNNVDADHTINASFARSNYDDDDDDDGKDIKDPEVPLGGLQLNKDDHFAYIKGYADGTVRPNNFITRAQVATIFYRLMTEETRMLCFSDTNDFSDVPADYWANKAISTLSNAGIITGFSDGTFRPNAYITRAQFAAIAARFSVVTEDLPNPFSDVPEGYWAEDLIAYAAHLGWVNGYPDGTFRPTANITRAAAMKLINNVLERQVDEDGLLEDATQWNDCTPDDWCYYIVMEATNSHDWERRSKKSLVEDWTALTADRVWDE